MANEEVAQMFARYIAAFMDGDDLDDPDFAAATTPLALGRFLSRRVSCRCGEDAEFCRGCAADMYSERDY